LLPRPSAHVSQIGATRGHPIHPWSLLVSRRAGIVHSPQLLPSRSFWPLTLCWPGQSLPATHTRPVIPCSARNTITTLLLHHRIAVSLAPQLARYLYINVPFFPCSACFHPHPCPPQGATTRRRGVVCTPVSGSDRPIDSPPPNRDRTPASCNPAPAVSHKAAETRHASPGAIFLCRNARQISLKRASSTN
jgi:hypothetical protein